MGEDGKADIIPSNHWVMANMMGWEHGFRKLFYLGLRNISQKWTMPIKDWKPALNQFTIRFGDRIYNGDA